MSGLSILEVHKMIRVPQVVTWPIVFIGFDNRHWHGGLLQLIKNDNFLSIFSRFGPFLKVFGQVKEWLILELHKIIRVPHVVAPPIVFVLFYGRDWKGYLFKVRKNDHFFNSFIIFLLLSQVFGHLNQWPILELHETIRMRFSSCVPNCFYFVWWPRLAERSAQTYEKWSIFSIFRRFGHFPHGFGQVNKCPILKLHEMIRVLRAIACPVVFVFFMIGIGKEECSKLWKMIFFFCFHQFRSFPPSFWEGSWVTYINISWNDKSRTCNSVRNCFCFVLWSGMAGTSVQIYGKLLFFWYIYPFWSFPNFLGRLKNGPY